MALADKGIDIRQDNAQLLIRVALTDADGVIVTTGTSTVYIYELQADGTLFQYDFNDQTFKGSGVTTPTSTLSHQQADSVITGIWTKAITNISDFTDGGIYIIRVTNTNAVPDEQFREFQWSGVQGEIANAVWDEALTGATHNVATSSGRRLRGIGEFSGYEGGQIWINTLTGTTGTTVNTNGLSTLPCRNIADANTLAADGELNIVRFAVAPLSEITFAENQDGDTFNGVHWTLALGGQSISNTIIEGANVSGIGTGASQPHFDDCDMSAVTLSACHIHNSILNNTLTISATGDYHFRNLKCITAAVVDFGSGVASTTVIMDDFSGDLEVKNMGQSGTDVLFIEGKGKLTVNANCTGGTIYIRGNIELSDNGAATINDDGRMSFDKAGLTATGTITFGEMMKMLNSMAHLNFVKSGSDLLFYDDDWVSSGSPGTLLYTVSVNEGTGITVVDA